jgi:PAS domain S-box-containing protein
MDRSLRILHVDDDPEFAELTAAFLEREDGRFVVETETSAESALDRLLADTDAFDCVISDYQMPEMTGIEFLRAFRDRAPNATVPFVLLTGKGSEEVAAEALNAGATSYVQKGAPDTYEYLAGRISRDIEQTRARRDSDRFGTLVRALDDPVYVLDEEGRFTYVNEAFVELTGYDCETIIGSSPTLIKDEQAATAAERQLGVLLSDDGPESITFEVEIQPATGDPIGCEDHMCVLPYEGERFRGSVGVLRDISAPKERIRAIRRRKERYRMSVERNLVARYLARDGQLLYHDETFADLFGHPAEANALVGEPLSSLVVQAERERLDRTLRELQAGVADAVRRPYVAVTPDDERLGVELLGRGIAIDGERAVLGSVVDVDADDDAEYHDRRRERDRLDEFTSIVSHDLRNPLNVAQSSVRWLDEEIEADGPEVDAAFERTVDALDRMEQLLADVLELAHQGETIDDPEVVDIARIATETWRNVSTGAGTLDVSAAGTTTADRSRLASLFENLYRNAIRHGGPDVTVRVGDLDDGFYVADDGPGISPEDRERIFESGYTTVDGGTGFGLAIVAGIVDAHGWRVAATASRDGGTRIEISGDERSVDSEATDGDTGTERTD